LLSVASFEDLLLHFDLNHLNAILFHPYLYPY